MCMQAVKRVKQQYPYDACASAMKHNNITTIITANGNNMELSGKVQKDVGLNQNTLGWCKL